MTGPQLMSLVCSAAIIVALFEMLRRHRLREKYAVIWFSLAVGALVGAIFPQILTAAADAIGLEVPANLLFFVSTIVLLGLSLQLSYELGRTEERVRTLAEEVALIQLRLDEGEMARPKDGA